MYLLIRRRFALELEPDDPASPMDQHCQSSFLSRVFGAGFNTIEEQKYIRFQVIAGLCSWIELRVVDARAFGSLDESGPSAMSSLCSTAGSSPPERRGEKQGLRRRSVSRRDPLVSGPTQGWHAVGGKARTCECSQRREVGQ